jgi:1,2-diacylglycerol 3-alpha-glucosyltransferase
MKIAMFTDSYYPAIDGVVVSLTTTSKELKRLGHDVVVFAPEPVGDDLRDPPDRVVWLPALAFKGYSGYRSALFPSSIVSKIRKERPDVIHSHGISFAGVQALLASRNTGIPNLLTYHTMLAEAADHYAPPILPVSVIVRLGWIYQRNFLKRPHIVITPTKAIMEDLKEHGVKTKRWEILPTGVDCNRFSPSASGKAIRERHGLDKEKVILTVGRIAKEKNLELLLRGFAELSRKEDGLRLLIAGTGPASSGYREMAEKMGLGKSVIFPGFVPDSELASYYAASDAFAIASKFETQGIVALEAMASGKPVAAMNSKVFRETIEDGVSGYLFEDDPESCANALRKAIYDEGKTKNTALKIAREMSLEKCVGELVGLYDQLLVRAMPS